MFTFKECSPLNIWQVTYKFDGHIVGLLDVFCEKDISECASLSEID